MYGKDAQPDFCDVWFLACMGWSQCFQALTAGLAVAVWSGGPSLSLPAVFLFRSLSYAHFCYTLNFSQASRNAFSYVKKYAYLDKACEIFCVLNTNEIFFLFSSKRSKFHYPLCITETLQLSFLVSSRSWDNAWILSEYLNVVWLLSLVFLKRLKWLCDGIS